jgi:hypothetical protein
LAAIEREREREESTMYDFLNDDEAMMAYARLVLEEGTLPGNHEPDGVLAGWPHVAKGPYPYEPDRLIQYEDADGQRIVIEQQSAKPHQKAAEWRAARTNLMRVVEDADTATIMRALSEGVPPNEADAASWKRENRRAAQVWENRAAAEYMAFSAWFIDQLTAGRDPEPLTFDRFVRETGVWSRCAAKRGETHE